MSDKLYKLLHPNEESIIEMVIEARYRVLMTKPHATVMYTVDKNGEKKFYGVYDCAFELNDKGNFAKEQPAPQLLGDLIPYDKTPMHPVLQKIHAGAWCSASEDLFKKTVSMSTIADGVLLKKTNKS